MKAFFSVLVFTPRPISEKSSALRRAALFMALLLVPTGIVILLLRLLTFSLLSRTAVPDLGELLRSNAVLPIACLTVAFMVTLLVRSRWPRIRLVVQFAIGLGTVSLLLLTAAHLGPWWMAEWLTLDALAYLIPDLLHLLCLTAAGVALLHLTRGGPRRLVAFILSAITGLLLVHALIAFSYYRETGAALDVAVLRYFVAHTSDLLPLVMDSITPATLAILMGGLLLFALPSLVMAWQPVRQWLRHSEDDIRGRVLRHWMLQLVPLAVLLALPWNRLTTTPPPATLAGLVATWSAERLADVPDDLLETTLAYDARSLRFVPTDAVQPLNVVVLVLESVRRRSVTPYDTLLQTMPFLQQLSRQAAVVEQMFTVVPHTNKSLTSIFGGMYPEPSRALPESEPGGIPAVGLPDLLEPHGYASAFFTPATLAYERKDILLGNLGFQTIRGDGDYPTDGFHQKEYFGYEDRIMLPAVLDWLDAQQTTGTPFLLGLLTLSAHHPYDLPPGFEKQDYTYEAKLNDYYNALRYTDDLLRDLWAAFEERGLLDETLFVILGDHGEAFGEHGLRTHGDVIWDEALEIPMLLINPRLFPERRTIGGLRQNIDLVPTVADALGYTLDGGTVPGHSLLLPVPAGRTLYHSPWNGRLALALRRDTLKYIYHYERQPMQVFNTAYDPLETTDVADQVSQASREAARLAMIRWRHQVQQSYLAAQPTAIRAGM